MAALLDWVGVEKKYRPTAPGMAAIEREFMRESEDWLFLADGDDGPDARQEEPTARRDVLQ